jgi:hypothetical protein
VILLNFLVGLLHRHADPIDRNAARRTPSRARRPPRAPHTTRPGGLPSDRRRAARHPRVAARGYTAAARLAEGQARPRA